MTHILERSEPHRAQLRRLLSRSFSLEELKTLCFDIGVDFDELDGDQKTGKIRELLLLVDRTNQLETLIDAAAAARPNRYWPRAAEPDALSPYRGLRSFEEENARFFFGRQTFTQQLIRAVDDRPLVAVVGSSGSGKSSVVFAGLLPQLRRKNTWISANFRPSTEPLHELCKSLIPLLEPEMSETDQLLETDKLKRGLKDNNISLIDVLNRIIQRNDKRDLLLVIDQFEELYTYCADPDIRQFLDVLLTAVSYAQRRSHREPKVRIVLTIRGDYMGRALAYRPLADALQNCDEKLGPMTREELQAVIELPARQANLTFDYGLVERILDDLVDGGQHHMDSGNLPLLEFALEQLWELRTPKGRLTHNAYEAIGEVAGAISRYADEIYEGLTPEEQNQVRWILIQMVHPGDMEDTRRLVTSSEIGTANWQLVKRLAEDRLVVTDPNGIGKEIAEVIHEALIQKWDRMQAWMKQDRPFRTWQDQMRICLKQWQASQSDDDMLSGTLLNQSYDWVASRKESLSQEEILFIEASIATNKILRRRAMAFQVMTGGLSATIATAGIVMLISYFLWQPELVPLPQFAYMFLTGLMGGLLGGMQGVMTMVGLIIADTIVRKGSKYVRALSGIAFGGMTGGLLFILLEAAQSFLGDLSFRTVFFVGFMMFGLASGACVIAVDDASNSRSLLQQTLMGMLAAGLASFIAVWVLYNVIDLSQATEFLPTAVGFTVLESMFGAGISLALALSKRRRFRQNLALGSTAR